MGTRNSTYERHPDDWYVEEEWCVRALVNRERFTGSVWDPACGLGRIPAVFRERGFRPVWASDLRERGCEGAFVHDFLNDPKPRAMLGPDNIIMNPPFKRGRAAKRFIERAVTIARSKVAVFVPIGFLPGNRKSRRMEMYQRLPLSRVWILSDRPSVPTGDFLAAGGTAEGGSTDFCWLVFHHGYDGEARIGFLSRADGDDQRGEDRAA